MDELTTKLEISVSRTDLPIPIINGIHLHSIYNPIKEAEGFADAHKETLLSNSKILVLGLGFAYHIEAMIAWGEKNNKEFEFLVIEPNTQLAQAYLNNRPKLNNVILKSYQDIASFFYDKEFIQFLMTRPSIIKHDTSFNLDRDFYTKLLTYHSPDKIKIYFDRLSSDWQQYFNGLPEAETLESITTQLISRKRIKDKQDLLLIALDEIKNNSQRQR